MRHLSFDFWNTIGKPNKTYARRRSELLADVFHTTAETAKATYTKVKGQLDHLAEIEGSDKGLPSNIVELCEAFGCHDTTEAFRNQLQFEMDRLFSIDPPTIDASLVEQLHRASARDLTLSIGSNTNFIAGRTIMGHVIGDLPFAFAVFSDEIGYSKPHTRFFNTVADHAICANPLVTQRSDIVHIGDNRVCDCNGADLAGMRSAFTENADHTAVVVANLLKDN